MMKIFNKKNQKDKQKNNNKKIYKIKYYYNK